MAKDPVLEKFYKVRCPWCSFEIPIRLRVFILDDGSLDIQPDDYYQNGTLFTEKEDSKKDFND